MNKLEIIKELHKSQELLSDIITMLNGDLNDRERIGLILLMFEFIDNISKSEISVYNYLKELQ